MIIKFTYNCYPNPLASNSNILQTYRLKQLKKAFVHHNERSKKNPTTQNSPKNSTLKEEMIYRFLFHTTQGATKGMIIVSLSLKFLSLKLNENDYTQVSNWLLKPYMQQQLLHKIRNSFKIKFTNNNHSDKYKT